MQARKLPKLGSGLWKVAEISEGSEVMIDRQYALRVSAHTGSEVSPHAGGQHELGRFSAGKADRKGLEGPAGIRKYLKGLFRRALGRLLEGSGKVPNGSAGSRI